MGVVVVVDVQGLWDVDRRVVGLPVVLGRVAAPLPVVADALEIRRPAPGGREWEIELRGLVVYDS